MKIIFYTVSCNEIVRLSENLEPKLGPERFQKVVGQSHVPNDARDINLTRVSPRSTYRQRQPSVSDFGYIFRRRSRSCCYSLLAGPSSRRRSQDARFVPGLGGTCMLGSPPDCLGVRRAVRDLLEVLDGVLARRVSFVRSCA